MTRDEPADRRLREAFAASTGPAKPPGDCPADAEIWAATRGELPAERTGALLDHSLECGRCRQSWQTAAALAAEGGLEAGSGGGRERAAPPAGPIPFRSRHHRLVTTLVAMAASLVLLVALTTVLNKPPVPAPGISLAGQTGLMLWKVGAEGDQPLTGGESLAPGDRIYLTVASAVPVHLYVINSDATGESAALFPLAEAQWSNPLPAGESLRLPGDAAWPYDAWEVTSAGGQEAFTLVASLQPLPELEAAVGMLSAAMPEDRLVRGGEEALPQAGAPPGEVALSLTQVLARIEAEAPPESVAIRRIVLQNPGPSASPR
jgi:hypothetical protein